MPSIRNSIAVKNPFKRAVMPSEAPRLGRNARNDWRIACILFAAMLLSVVAISAIIYNWVSGGELLSETKETQSPRILDQFELERVIALYDAKEAQFEDLKRRPLSTKDPFISALELKTN